MKLIVLVGLGGAAICLLTWGAVGAFLNGVNIGHLFYAPRHTLDAAAQGAFLALIWGGIPAAAIGLFVGAIIGAIVADRSSSRPGRRRRRHKG